MKIMAILVGCALLSGCVVGTKINYTEGNVALDKFSINDEGGCSLNVVDERSYVVSGNKSPEFVGIRRGAYGNPYDVLTESGFPLAYDLTLLFKRTYSQTLDTRCNQEPEEASKTITYTLNEWKTDVYHRGRFFYDVDVEVKSGDAQISNENTKGTIVLNKNFVLHQAIAQAMNEIHQNPKTKEAIAL